MAMKTQAKKRSAAKSKRVSSVHRKSRLVTASTVVKRGQAAVVAEPARSKESAKEREARERRREVLQKMLLGKRQQIMKEIEESLGQSLTDDQQRRLESARDVGDPGFLWGRGVYGGEPGVEEDIARQEVCFGRLAHPGLAVECCGRLRRIPPRRGLAGRDAATADRGLGRPGRSSYHSGTQSAGSCRS